MSAFGKLIKSKRAGRKTQEEVATRIGITQPQLGRWERGESHPNIKELDIIIRSFNDLELPFTSAEKAELRASLMGERSKSPVALLSQEGYFEEQAQYLEKMQREWEVAPRSIRICFLGGNSPVIDSEEVQDDWIQNLGGSMSYCIFWCIDAMSPVTIDKLSGALTRISIKLRDRNTSESCGLIRHYPIFLDNSGAPSPQKEEGIRRYRQLKDCGLSHNLFHELNDPTHGVVDLQAYFQCFGNMVTYLSTDRAPTPLTALILDRARLHTDSKPRPVYLFLDDEKSRSIADSLREIMTRFDSLQAGA
jgi:transcriptional regulator with XRE-family HTH domain